MIDRKMIVRHVSNEMVLAQDAKLLTRKIVNGVATDDTSTYCVKRVRPRRLAKRDLLTDPQLVLVTEKVFEFYADRLAAAGAPIPKKDDQIIDGDARTWVIVKVDESLSDQVVNCFVRKVV